MVQLKFNVPVLKTVSLSAVLLVHIASAGVMPCAALLDSGDAAYGRFDNRTALYCYTRAYAGCPAGYDALMKMTRALIDEGEDVGGKEAPVLFKKGLRYSDTLLQRFSDSAQPYFLKAVAAGNIAFGKSGMMKLTYAKMVERNVKMSIELAPSFAPAYVVLGTYYREVATAGVFQTTLARVFFGGMPSATLEDARHSLQKALELSPENMYGLLELARTDIAMGNTKEAATLLKKMQTCPLAWHLDAKTREQGSRLLMQLR